jgi:bacterioferritin-associated ferredoxin
MIVCVCNNVSDRQIRKAVDAGMDSMLEMRLQLQVGTDCGKCHSCAKRVLRESLEDARQEQPLLFQPAALAA